MRYVAGPLVSNSIIHIHIKSSFCIVGENNF
jgi:hypothetical protein